MRDFKQFLLRGNLVELAVAVVIAIAFEAVVTSLADDLLLPVVGIFGGSPDFSANTFTVNGSEFRWGSFVTAVVSFAIVAAVVFFLVVKPMNAVLTRMRTEPTPDPLTKKCPECMSEVQVGARRCPFCTSALATAAD